MSKIEFKVEIDSTSPAELAAAVTFLQTLQGEKQEAPKAEAPKKEAKAPAKKNTPKQEAKPQTDGTPQQEQPNADVLPVEDLQLIVKEKAGKHRPALKAKLQELDAKGVGDVYNKYLEDSPEKVIEFVDFVKGLA
jgi:hypothetical protein